MPAVDAPEPSAAAPDLAATEARAWYAAFTVTAEPDVPVAISQMAAPITRAMATTKIGQRGRPAAAPPAAGGAGAAAPTAGFSPGSSRTRHASATESTSMQSAGGWGFAG